MPDETHAAHDPAPGEGTGFVPSHGWTDEPVNGGARGSVAPVDARSSDRVGGGEHNDFAEGEVRAFRERVEHDLSQRPWIVWTFRVERFDEDGNMLRSVPVVMRGRSFRGFIDDGNHVRVHGKRRPGGSLEANGVRNLTTDSTVVSRSYRPAMIAAIGALVVIGGAMIAVAIVVFLSIRDSPKLEPPPEATAANGGDLRPTVPPLAENSDTTESNMDPPPPPETAVVIVDCVPPGSTVDQVGSESFALTDVEVDSGAEVAWANTTDTPLVVAFDSPELPDADAVLSGDEHRVTLSEPGSYDYSCLADPDADVDLDTFKGTIVVRTT